MLRQSCAVFQAKLSVFRWLKLQLCQCWRWCLLCRVIHFLNVSASLLMNPASFPCVTQLPSVLLSQISLFNILFPLLQFLLTSILLSDVFLSDLIFNQLSWTGRNQRSGFVNSLLLLELNNCHCVYPNSCHVFGIISKDRIFAAKVVL